MKEALKKAKNLEYQFLFHHDEHEKAFMESDRNEVLMIEGAVLFIENSDNRSTVYPAYQDAHALKRALGGLYHLFGNQKTVYINLSESKANEGILEKVHTTFANAGCKLVNDNIAMVSKRLVGIRQVITDNVKPFDGYNEALYQLTTDLLVPEIFDMTFEDFEAMLTAKDSIVLTIQDENTIKGFVYGLLYNNNQSVFIRGLGVHNEFQGMGLSKKLMQGLFLKAQALKVKSIMLWVEANNIRAINLYKQFDFKPYGDKERLYSYRVR